MVVSVLHGLHHNAQYWAQGMPAQLQPAPAQSHCTELWRQWELRGPLCSVCLQLFRWPHYGKLGVGEVLSVKVYNCSKVFSNR